MEIVEKQVGLYLILMKMSSSTILILSFEYIKILDYFDVVDISEPFSIHQRLSNNKFSETVNLQ